MCAADVSVSLVLRWQPMESRHEASMRAASYGRMQEAQRRFALSSSSSWVTLKQHMEWMFRRRFGKYFLEAFILSHEP